MGCPIAVGGDAVGRPDGAGRPDGLVLADGLGLAVGLGLAGGTGLEAGRRLADAIAGPREESEVVGGADPTAPPVR